MALYIDGKLIAGIGNDGITPHIGDNGNWFLGDEDTGVHAQGPQGEQGETGVGTQGPQGETGEGVPSGGNAGQVLTKKTNSDYDTEWKDPPTPESGGVTSFNGREGAVVPADGDYTAEQVNALPITGGTLTGNLILSNTEENEKITLGDSGYVYMRKQDSNKMELRGKKGVIFNIDTGENLLWNSDIVATQNYVDEAIASAIDDAWATAY